MATLVAFALSLSCPHGLQPLSANSVAPATVAAIAHEAPKSRPLVVSASIATADRERGPEAKRLCGTAVWQRTVVVYIKLRAYAFSASLSERVDYVGRFRDGYRVWQVVH